ncbi:MAG: LysE family transporter [Hyphomicrobiales bacterium]
MDIATQIATLALVYFLACISPGPDFIVVTSHALSGRKAGLHAALGVACGCMLWVGLAILGLGFVLSGLAWLHQTLRMICAAVSGLSGRSSAGVGIPP